jgi:protein phosphatase
VSVGDLGYASEGVDECALTHSLDTVIEILQSERKSGRIMGGKIMESFVELSMPRKLAVVGDLHGDITSLWRILHQIDAEAFLGDSHNKLIFLGDYVDRGSNSVAVLFAICSLKKKFPGSVILMRGNHEAPLEFPFPSHNLPTEVIKHYGYHRGKLIYNEKILPFFRFLTLATLIEGSLFLVHGGVPTGTFDHTYKETICNAERTYTSNTIMEEILWNDPRQGIRNKDGWEYSRRGIGKHFGIEISRKWLRLSQTRVIVRGHEPCQGFRIDHDGSVVTLFSCQEPYPSFQAAYISINEQELKSINDAAELSSQIYKI